MSPPDAAADHERIAATLSDLLAQRRPGASLCPSELARALWPDPVWRAHLPELRGVLIALARAGRLRLMRGGVLLDPDDPGRGPLRVAGLAQPTEPTAGR